MEKPNPQEIMLLINNLTDNKDHRQDLWVHYLSGNSKASLSQYLKTIRSYEDSEIHRVADTVCWLLHYHGEYEFQLFLEGFSELEQTIMCLLAIGCSVQEISQYRNLSIIRVQQVVTTIRNHSKWENKWHLNDISQTKKSTD